MNGIEVESILFSHQLHRQTTDTELRQNLAMVRRIEQQQQKAINWLLPGNETPLETTLGYEQVAVDLTAFLAKTEPDPIVKAALDFALIEDFDHLYRYANLYELTENKKAESIIGDFTEVFPGRPTANEHRHPTDTVRNYVEFRQADILTKLHVLTIIAAEQQTMNFYMNVGAQAGSRLSRGLYQEIAMIEEQHVTHYGSLNDPTMSWFEQLLLHEYNECYLYYSCMASEVDPKVKAIWQKHLEFEIEHLKIASDLFRRIENRDPEAMFPSEFPELTTFHSNKEYVRSIVQNQTYLTGNKTEYTPVADLSETSDYFRYQNAVNGDGFVPSEMVIRDHVNNFDLDYRLETEGEHPLQAMRDRRQGGSKGA